MAAEQSATKRASHVVKWQPDEIHEGSLWFRRLYKECKKISPHIRFKRVKNGFYRLYWRQAYFHEVYKEMPMIGYTMDDLDPRFENQKYFEEYEDQYELTRKIKNFVEGYHDSHGTIERRNYMMRNDKEFYDTARKAYKQMRIV